MLPAILPPGRDLPLLLQRPDQGDPIATLTWARSKNKEGHDLPPRWYLKGSPAVILLAKRLFSDTAMGKNNISFPADEAIFEDLLMLQHRYPIEIAPTAREVWNDHYGHLVDRWLIQNARVDDALDIGGGSFRGTLKPFQTVGVRFMLGGRHVLLADDMGLGKAQPVNAHVLTPAGWKRIGSISVGDQVIGADGLPTEVVGVFPQGTRHVFRVLFSDGATAECCDEHLWRVTSPVRKRRGSGWLTLPLAEIRTNLKDAAGNSRFQIPLVRPIQFEERTVPLDPYLLGLLLGDGCFTGHDVMFSTADQELVDAARSALPDGCSLRHKVYHDYRIVSGAPGQLNPVRRALKALGLTGNGSDTKFIPRFYLHNAVGCRLAILQGLMDTDGYVSREGTVQFSSNSSALANGVAEIVQSLGGVARRSWKRTVSGKRHHILTIALPDGFNPFRLIRKASLTRPRAKYPPSRAIRHVMPVGERECVCIRVASPDQLYVTEDYVVTHNTPQSLALLAKVDQWPVAIICQPHVIPHWRRKIEEFLDCEEAPGESGKLAWTHLTGTKPRSDIPKANIYLLHYLIAHGWDNWLKARGVKVVVFDEAQELRHTGTKKHDACQLICRSADRVVGLSGTPIYNRGPEIYNVMNTLNRGCLGTFVDFKDKWCTIDDSGKWIVKEPAELGQYLRDRGLMLRRTKDEVMSELPEKRRIIEPITADNKAFAMLIREAQRLARSAVNIKDPFDRARMEAEAIAQTRLATGVAKSPAVVAFLRGLMEAEEPTLVFAHHHAVYDTILIELAEFNPVSITGRETLAVKDRSQQAFVRGDTNLCLISLRAATGLDGLQERARVVTFAELDWSPAIHRQAEDRAHRYGQRQSVLAYYLVTDVGTDPHIMHTLNIKESQFTGLMHDPDVTEDDVRAAQQAAEKHKAAILKMLRSHS